MWLQPKLLGRRCRGEMKNKRNNYHFLTGLRSAWRNTDLCRHFPENQRGVCPRKPPPLRRAAGRPGLQDRCRSAPALWFARQHLLRFSVVFFKQKLKAGCSVACLLVGLFLLSTFSWGSQSAGEASGSPAFRRSEAVRRGSPPAVQKRPLQRVEVIFRGCLAGLGVAPANPHPPAQNLSTVWAFLTTFLFC